MDSGAQQLSAARRSEILERLTREREARRRRQLDESAGEYAAGEYAAGVRGALVCIWFFWCAIIYMLCSHGTGLVGGVMSRR
jgi:hypothetical protein